MIPAAFEYERAESAEQALALIEEFRTAGLWPPVVPTMVLVESLQGHSGRDANANRFLKTVLTDDSVAVEMARRAAELRRRSRHGAAVDALVVTYLNRLSDYLARHGMSNEKIHGNRSQGQRTDALRRRQTQSSADNHAERL